MPPTEMNTNNRLQQNILETKGLENYKEAIEMAYQILLRQLCKKQDEVFDTIEKLKSQPLTEGQAPHNRYRITFDLSEQRDFIVLTLVDGKRHEFSRAKFLEKKRIKSDLIAYYKPMGLFVRPPHKTQNSDVWNIDLLFRADIVGINNIMPPLPPPPGGDSDTADPHCEEVIVEYTEENDD